MHILCFANSFDVANSSGSGRLNDLVDNFIAKGHRVIVITSSFDYLTGNMVSSFNGGLASKENYGNLTVIRGWCYNGYNKRKLDRVLTFISFLFSSTYCLKFVKRYDAIFVGTPPFFLGIPGLIANYLRKSKFYYEVRDLWVDVAIELGYLKSKIIIKIIRLLEHNFFLKADRVITNSPAFAKYISNTGVVNSKIKFIPNGVDLDMFFPESKQKNFILRKGLGLENKFIVIYTGAHGEANNLSYLIDAAKILKKNENICFLLIGDGNRKFDLVKKAKSKLLNNVKFLDPVPKNKLSKYISMADVGLAILKPTGYLKTTYPNKVFDYMACSTLCIVAIDGVIRDLVESSGAGIFSDPTNPDDLANAILKLAESSKDSINRFGQNGIKTVTKHFNRTDCTNALVKIIT